jgi:hypothetical protein
LSLFCDSASQAKSESKFEENEPEAQRDEHNSARCPRVGEGITKGDEQKNEEKENTL